METALSRINNLNDSLLKNNLKDYKGSIKVQTRSNDSLSIGIMTPEKTQAILNRELADKLEQRFKKEGIKLKGLDTEDFTPEKVSDRIINFVSTRILSEQDSKQQQELMAQARAGVEQGFAEARDILDNLSVLNGKVKGDVDKTYTLLQQGLDKLTQQINGKADNDNDKESQESSGQAALEDTAQISMQSRFSRSETTHVDILTNEGDRVRIELFNNQNTDQQTRFQETPEGNSINSTRSISASAGISYQLKGELNKDEQNAIDELLASVVQVSERFFSGNVQNAFQYARSMDFNTQELTQFSLNMGYQETRQLAINTYSNYLPEDSGKTGKVPALQEASKSIRQLDELLQHPFAQQKFADPAKTVSELLKVMSEQLDSSNMQQLPPDPAAMLDNLVAQIRQFRGAENVATGTENSVVSGST